MSRRRRRALIVLGSLALVGVAFLVALPEIVRWVAVDQIPKRTGRAVAIEDVDLNLFTGHLALKKVRLADRDGPEPFLEFERFDFRLSLPALLRSHLRVVEIALVSPTIRVVRHGPAEFNFSDLLVGAEPAPEPDPATPSRWTVTVERLALSGARVHVDDRAVSPSAEWRIHELDVRALDLTTRAGAPAGQLAGRGKIDEATLSVSASPLRLEPLQVNASLSFHGFEMRRLNPYVYIPLKTPYRPKGGVLALTLVADIDSDADEVTKATLSGTVTLEREAMAQVGHDEPFLTVSRLGVDLREADALARSLTVASVTVDGLDLKARRGANGVIDLVEIFKPPAAAPSSPARAAEPSTRPEEPPRRRLFPILQALSRGFQQIRVERISLTPSTAIFIDDAVKPQTSLALKNLQARIDNLTVPTTGPASVTFSTGLPGGGTLAVKGPFTLQPLEAAPTISVRNAPVEPYQAYIPVPAQLSGRFNGDSTNRIAFRDGGLVALSKGTSWGQNVAIRAPGSERPLIRVDRMELVGIDLDWPKRASLARAGFRRPRVEIERAADGSIDVRRLFTPPDAEAAAPSTEPEPAASAGPERPKSKALHETMQLAFGELRIEDGFIRFLDRTTEPAFSQDLSRLDVKMTDFGNRPDRRAKLAVQSVVGGDGALDIRGEIGPLGQPAFVDLVGELRSFSLPSVDPYSETAIGWAIKQGELQYKMRFKLEGDQLTAENDVVVGKLQVAPASGTDEVKRRVGLPLGLIVALIKDQQGDIRATVPVTGTVNDPQFKLGDTIWTAVKNVLVNIVRAPFKAIGRLFSDAEQMEEPKVDPVTFAAGSSVLSPAMEDHLLRVADFLRRAPFVNLTMSAVPSPADVEALKNEALAARLREFQKEHGLADMATAVAVYLDARLPGVKPPATLEERLALLGQQEPVPEALLADLGERRLDTTRARLLQAEGIPESRLKPEATGADTPAATGEGRVDFGITAGE